MRFRCAGEVVCGHAPRKPLGLFPCKVIQWPDDRGLSWVVVNNFLKKHLWGVPLFAPGLLILWTHDQYNHRVAGMVGESAGGGKAVDLVRDKDASQREAEPGSGGGACGGGVGAGHRVLY
jgi:hypothetical protein